MPALTIMIIRHGEKPDPATNLGSGLTQSGEVDPHSLVVRGWQRAGSWAALFGAGLGLADYAVPDVVFAANPQAAPDPNDPDGPVSQRPWETVLPLCERRQMTAVTQYGVGDEHAMLGDAQGRTGTVLICWEHKKIAKVIWPALAPNEPPIHWNRDRFDVVLRFDRAQGSGGWRARQLFPRLLSGDSNTPLPPREGG